MLLDEPAAGMNQAEAAQLVRTIRLIRDRGVTVVLVEHNMRMVMGLCSRITVLARGKVIAEGTPTEIQRKDAVIEAYLGRPRAAC
jgi:branched-chain amino acid transport system permease protein